jgi:hypothetical protein
MFEAAGLARINLRPLLAAFLVGRLVSYTVYVSAASAAHHSLKHIFDQGLFSPQAIATQVVCIGLLIAMIFIDWPSVIDKVRGWWAVRRGRPAPRPIRETLPPEDLICRLILMDLAGRLSNSSTRATIAHLRRLA